ncbi:MAG: FAD-dependent oxidoreductase [Acidobacteriota bacterium]|nr:FAD-dependent oxidoreductase [Acidobacteriota bacterium]
MPESAEVIVVGSGPGGATVARELARAGRRVLIVERGADHRGRWYHGTHLGALRYTERGGLLFTREGLQIVRPMMVGGATALYCASAAPPPPWLASRYGIDLQADAAAAAEELGVAPLDEELRGEASTRIAQAAQTVGQRWEPQPKFFRPERAGRFRCGAHCMLGCRCGAKWSAAESVDQAVVAGARLLTGVRVERVLVEGGRARGVVGRRGRTSFEARAEVVVLAAGGLGSPPILRRSGLEEAGRGLAMDTTVMVYGVAAGRGIGREPPMTWSWEDPRGRFMLSTLVDPWLLFPLMAFLAHPRHLLRWPRWGRMLGVMIKVRDQVSGGIGDDLSISKPLTGADRAVLEEAGGLARSILLAAGAAPGTLFTTPLRGTHPSATVRIGEMLDHELATSIAGLFVCDASVFPEALGRPTVLTLIAFARRLARRLR